MPVFTVPPGVEPSGAILYSRRARIAAAAVAAVQLLVVDGPSLAGELVGKRNHAGLLVGGDVGPTVVDEFFGGDVGPELEDDHGHDALGPALVGHADDGGLSDGGVLGQAALDLGRVDVLRG